MLKYTLALLMTLITAHLLYKIAITMYIISLKTLLINRISSYFI